MKAKYILVAALAFGLTACENYFDEKYMDNGDPQIKVVETIDYTLSSDDYKTIAENKVNKKYAADGQDIGYVGEVYRVRPKILYDLLDNDYLPIVAPIGMDDNYDTYNINADEAASAIARSVKADKLVYLTDIAGLYKDINDPSSFINRITIAEAEQLIEDGVIGGGMLPKLTNCTQAVRGGVHRVHILDGRIPHSMLLEFFTEKGIGTMFHLKSDTDMQ